MNELKSVIDKFFKDKNFSLTLWGNKEIAESVIELHKSKHNTIYHKTD